MLLLFYLPIWQITVPKSVSHYFQTSCNFSGHLSSRNVPYQNNFSPELSQSNLIIDESLESNGECTENSAGKESLPPPPVRWLTYSIVKNVPFVKNVIWTSLQMQIFAILLTFDFLTFDNTVHQVFYCFFRHLKKCQQKPWWGVFVHKNPVNNNLDGL